MATDVNLSLNDLIALVALFFTLMTIMLGIIYRMIDKRDKSSKELLNKVNKAVNDTPVGEQTLRQDIASLRGDVDAIKKLQASNYVMNAHDMRTLKTNQESISNAVDQVKEVVFNLSEEMRKMREA